MRNHQPERETRPLSEQRRKAVDPRYLRDTGRALFDPEREAMDPAQRRGSMIKMSFAESFS